MRNGCFLLAVCWMVLAAPISTPARQAMMSENPQPRHAGVCVLFDGEPSAENLQQASEETEKQPKPQTQPAVPQQTQAQQKPDEQDKPSQDQQVKNGISNDRLFYLLPNFLTLENAANVPPFTTGEKFKAVAKGTFDPVQFGWYALLAGYGQATDDEPAYGQGALGYAKRYGASFGDSTIENFMVGAVMSSLFRQDPRYFQMGKGGFWRRTWYAATRVVVIRSDSRQEQFNASEFIGSALAAGISTYTYHPHSDQKLTGATTVWGTQVGLDAVANFTKEFWPDVRRHFRKKRTSPPGEM